MQTSSRRIFLRNGALLGASAILGIPSLRKVHAANTETLVLYNGQHPKTTQSLVDAFTKATGIRVEIRKGGSTQLANQIIEEGGNSPADVFYSEESPPLAALAGRKLLATLPADIITQVRPGYTAKDSSWTGISARCRVTVYNREMVQEADLPASIMDMATAAWQDRVAYVPASGAFQQQLIAIKLLKGRDVALAWLEGLKKYGRIYNGNMAAMRAVERGEIATALVNSYYWFIVAKEIGADKMRSAMHFSGPQDPGALITVSAAGILKTARSPRAAQQMLAFMVSEAGQRAVTESVAEWPLRPGMSSPFDLQPFDALQPPEIYPDDLGDAADALALRREAGLA